MIEKTEKDIWKEIQSGKYRDFYLIYNRKSTDEKSNQKNSIRVQKESNSKYAKGRFAIAPLTLTSFCADGIISERHSGFKEDDTLTFTKDGLVQYRIDRPKFLKLVELLSKGLFKGIICLCWDRISRNKGDDTIVRKLMKSGVDIHFVYANYDKSSSGALHMDIDGMFAEHHSRVTSEKVTITTRNLRSRGICTYRAPTGYQNLGDMKNKPIDPVRGHIITKMFELYGKGKMSMSDIARWANNQGFTMAPMRRRRTNEEMLAEEIEDDKDNEESNVPKITRPVLVNNIQKILVNKFYTGRMLGNNKEWVESNSHKALVSDKLFEKVQLMLKKKRVSTYYTDKVECLYRGIIRCGVCGRVYTPYKHKGIQYYGSRCQNNCTNTKKSFNVTFLEKEIEKIVKNLSFSDEEIIELDARTKTDIAIFEQKRIGGLEENDRKKKKMREDLNYLRTNKLSLLKSEVYSPESYLEEEKTLNASLLELQGNEQNSDIAMHEVIKDIVKLSELVKYGYEHYLLANSEEKEQIIRIIISELSLSENTLTYKGRNGICVLQNRLNVNSDPTENRTLI